jgi:hypothetical protein
MKMMTDEIGLNEWVMVAGPNTGGNRSAIGVMGRVVRIELYAAATRPAEYHVDLAMPTAQQRDVWEFHRPSLTPLDHPPTSDIEALGIWLDS